MSCQKSVGNPEPEAFTRDDDSRAVLLEVGGVAGLGIGGEGQNRTVDTTIFSRMLYQLSYLATR